eukprot:CAMPEP_0202711966 /NCGR_PEP_ID=MMETSP1385-20130828/30600_1 /ASSEMBLY_ACC=CAM_ASM_000861 /TAXON_ID=933848 /ORGANISM="Elphidium margaritaceum" /LENGTH=58 /DNA_ID=CAMNT_0049371837 /DNA_START=104 /DNA_END=276 /DNA_ORIENTATION=+
MEDQGFFDYDGWEENMGRYGADAPNKKPIEPNMDSQPAGDQAVFELSPTTMNILVAVL